MVDLKLENRVDADLVPGTKGKRKAVMVCNPSRRVAFVFCDINGMTSIVMTRATYSVYYDLSENLLFSNKLRLQHAGVLLKDLLRFSLPWGQGTSG